MKNKFLCAILECNKCNIRKNQIPLLDKIEKADILWVGLSAKKILSDDEIPLSEQTNSGKIIKMAEDCIKKEINDISFRKTNLVKCLPLDGNQKLRYPNSKEIANCINFLDDEIQNSSAKIVFLLGDKVGKSVEKHLNISFEKNGYEPIQINHNGVCYFSIFHPSYIWVYKKKEIDDYIEGIKNAVVNVLKKI